MLSLALAAVLGYQQPTITFKSNFEPLGKVVEKLSAQTQIPMAAFGDLKGYPVYINVKDVPVKELLDRLATAAGAEWENKDNSYYLTASSSLRIAQGKAGDPELIAAIEATINQPIPKKKTPQEMEAAFKGMENNPQAAMKAMGEMMSQAFQADEGTLELLRSIGSKDLSSIVDGRRVVLSSTPTQMQGMLSGKSTIAIRKYIQDLAKEKLAKDKAKPPVKKNADGEEDFGDFDMTSMFGGGQGLRAPELANQIQTIQTVFQITQRTTLSVEISAFTSDGKNIYKRNVQMPIVNPQDAQPKVAGQTKLDVAPVARTYAQALQDGKKIDPMMNMLMSAQGGMASAMTMFMGGMEAVNQTAEVKPVQISPEMRALMREPDKNEPLSYLMGPLLDYQASQGKNVVAIPSDDVISTLSTQLTVPNNTVEAVMDAIDRTMTEKITNDGTWTIVQASSPLELRSAHCKRDSLANLVKSGTAKGYVNLDDCSKFATAQDTARGSEILALPIITAVFQTSDLGSASSLTTVGFDSLKLYATLTDYQKQALAAKRPVALAALTPTQTNIISRMVYNGMLPPFKAGEGIGDMMMEDDSNDGDGGMAGMAGLGMALAGPMLSAFGMGDVTMDSERTILLPTGIPVVGEITLKSIPMESVMAIDSATGNKMITMPEMLGMMNSDSMGMLPMFGNMKRSFDKYKLAKQTSYLLYFKLGRNASYFTSLYDVWVDDSKTYTQDQLPEKLKERMKPPAFEIPGKDDKKPPL